jgi:hypothetical protein
MSAIILRSTSGKWKYTTKTDDPLFSSIVGAMVEEGMKMPKSLTIPGSLGEELDMNWHYIKEMQDWMSWDTTCNLLIEDAREEAKRPKDVSSVDIASLLNQVMQGVPLNQAIMQNPALIARMQQVHGPGNVAQIPMPHNVNPVPSVTTIQVPNLEVTYPDNPTIVVWRHEMAVLVNALSLPEGWEAQVAVDERSPLVERVSHMRASMAYLRANPDSAKRIEHLLDPYMKGLYDRSDDPTMRSNVERGISLLAPFVRNVWLTAISWGISGATKTPYMSLTYLLQYLDWEVMYEIAKEYKDDERVQGVLSIAEAVTGKVGPMKSPYAVHLAKDMKCVGFGNGVRMVGISVYISQVSFIYSYILSRLPDDVSPSVMGLEPILGIKKVESWEAPPLEGLVRYTSAATTTSVSDIVGAINATVITYLRWYKERTQYVAPSDMTVYDANTGPLIPVNHFKKVVKFLGETLGLYVMRRILLCLLHYIGKNRECNETKRADMFCKLLEKHLEGKNGEYDGVLTFAFDKTKMVEKMAKYYV